MEIQNVTALAKANIYFEGKVISHTLITADGKRHTLGVILPGSYHFGTDAPERMQITAGGCRVVLDGSDASTDYAEGDVFEIPGKSGFTISTGEAGCQYFCSFLS
ncbi:MAG: pyrimidine/purine nucleoside phosphorylase [Terrimicrobiaceae bacterium]